MVKETIQTPTKKKIYLITLLKMVIWSVINSTTCGFTFLHVVYAFALEIRHFFAMRNSRDSCNLNLIYQL